MDRIIHGSPGLDGNYFLLMTQKKPDSPVRWGYEHNGRNRVVMCYPTKAEAEAKAKQLVGEGRYYKVLIYEEHGCFFSRYNN